MTNFDPYHKWLGIPPEEQPANHYRLLGLRMFENDDDVIENAAESKMLLLRARQTGPNADDCHRLLNEIAAARHCLLHPEARQRYNAKLRDATIEQALVNAPPVPSSGEEGAVAPPALPPQQDDLDLGRGADERRRSSGAAPRVPMEMPRAANTAGDSAPETAQDVWHVMTSSGEYFGKASTADLKKLAQMGHVTADSKLARDGSKEWISVATVVDEFGEREVQGAPRRRGDDRTPRVVRRGLAIGAVVSVVLATLGACTGQCFLGGLFAVGVFVIFIVVFALDDGKTRKRPRKDPDRWPPTS